MIINMNGAKAPETPSPVLQEKTVTPETLPTVIGADEGYDGLSQVTVNPDAQLKAENIRSGKTIFGVSGTFAGEEVHTDSIFPVLTDMTADKGNLNIERPTVLSKNTAVFSDNVGSISGSGRIEWGTPYTLMAADRTLTIGYAQKGSFYYTNNFPAPINASVATSVTLSSNLMFNGRSKCRIEYVVYPVVVNSDVDVGTQQLFDQSFSAASEIHRYDMVLDITGSEVIVPVPEIPESTVYYTSYSSKMPTGTYYCYWMFIVCVMECM